jgi:radical SAM superfamily enzyme YgiQ (UPF0313 family)
MDDSRTALVLLPPFWPNMPPLGLALLKGYLGLRGIEASLIDFNNLFFNIASGPLQKEWRKGCSLGLEEDMPAVLKREHPAEYERMLKQLSEYRTIGFSCYKSNMNLTLEIAEILKCGNRGLRVILGGPEIARRFFRDRAGFPGDLSQVADLLVVGEGERALERYLSGGLSYAKAAIFDEIDNPDHFSLPDYSDIDFSLYPRKNAASLFFSRGCIRKCRFCSERLLYKKFRTCRVSNILTQVESLGKTGISHFVFHDSLINGDLRSLESLCDGLSDCFGRVSWEAQIVIRPEMPDRLFAKLKKSGCVHLFVGLESGCDRTLKAMNKGFAARDAVSFFEKLNRQGLSFGVSIIVGYPGENSRDFDESTAFLIANKSLIPRIEQVNPFVYYEGTGLPESVDYRLNPQSRERVGIFIARIEKAGFKYTNAFVNNLIES